MATITAPTGVQITPRLVLGYESGREARNIVHQIPAREDPDVTYIPAALRSGSLELFFTTRVAAWAALALHALPGLFVYVDTLTEVSMNYVPTGRMAIALDPTTLTRWTLTVPYHEVTP